ncbi:hypothetical protein ACSHUI_00440 [Bacillus subtilis]|uniref:hypothetical protein n=1 Tax=Bacillus subtilis TaxID=1423 RepID=UPI003CF52B18
MKKFDVASNMEVVSSNEFKDSIRFAVEETQRNVDAGETILGKSFFGTIVAYDAKVGVVRAFAVRDYGGRAEGLNALGRTANHVSNLEGHSILTIIDAEEFTPNNNSGYSSQRNELENVLLENRFMKVYINILTGGRN